MAEGDSVRAEQYLAAALREGHEWREALPPLLRVCLTGSRLRAGLNYATPYLRSHPDELWLRYLVATVYLGLGQPLRAREHLHAIRGKAPYQDRTEYLLGQTEWEGFGNAAAAAAHFREYLRLEPNGTNAREVGEWLNVHSGVVVPRAALAGTNGGSAPAAGESAVSGDGVSQGKMIDGEVQGNVIDVVPPPAAVPAAAVVPGAGEAAP